MAVVFLAEDVVRHEAVAVKVLLPEAARILGRERFEREIAVAARLDHPNILPVEGSGVIDGTLYYVMPYVEGESLRQQLDRGPLPVANAVCIAREVAQALAHAHARDVIHRDVKPENILLSGARVLLADFGACRRMSAAGSSVISSAGIALGTPAYMSPEQAAARRLDARSDIYSLGCVLYEMLVGEPPFTGPNPHVVMAQRARCDVPPIRAVRAGVSAGLEQVVRCSLAQRATDRYASAEAFAAALARAA